MSSTLPASNVFEIPDSGATAEPRIVSPDSLPVLAYAKDSFSGVTQRYIRILAIVAFLIACTSVGPNIIKIYAEGFSLLLLDAGQRWVARAWGESMAYVYAIVLTSLSGVLLVGSIGLFFLRDWARRLLSVYALLAVITYAAAEVSGLFVVAHTYNKGESQGILGLGLAVGLVSEDIFVRLVFPLLMLLMLRLAAVQQLFHHPRALNKA